MDAIFVLVVLCLVVAAIVAPWTRRDDDRLGVRRKSRTIFLRSPTPSQRWDAERARPEGSAR
jgi:hypothetical protein